MYTNGNYAVRWFGKNLKLQKRAFRVNEELIPEFPDSIDLKITNKCSWGCPYCHESSTPFGMSFDLEKTKEILSQLPELPIEIAIGGGDILDEPKVKDLIVWLEERGNRTRATVNIKDILERRKSVNSLLSETEAIGVSMDKLPVFLKDWDNKDSMRATLLGGDDILPKGTGIYVIHIIAGIFPYQDLEELFLSCEFPILVLGYKQWGRAKNTPLPKDLDKFRETLADLILNMKKTEYDQFLKCNVIGFDNLALEQLDIRSLLPEDEWQSIYMGDEGTHSMYIDAVNGEFAKTSRSEERVSWNSIGLIDYFKSLRI